MSDFQKFVVLKKFPITIKEYVKERFKLTDAQLEIIEFNAKAIVNLEFVLEGDTVFQNNAKNIIYKYNDEERKDIAGDTVNSPFTSNANTEQDLKDPLAERIQFNYSSSEDFENIIIKPNTELWFPLEFLNRTLPYYREKEIVAPFTKFNNFVDDSIKRIITDNRYIRSARVGSNEDKNALNLHNLNISVTWMSKSVEAAFKRVNAIASSLLNTTPPSLFSQKAIDLTPFVISCSTSVGKLGGGFQLVLAPIVVECVDGVWELKKGVVNFRDKGSQYYMDAYSTTPNREGKLRREVFAFHHILQVNDLIAIKFEELEIERDPNTGASKRDSTLTSTGGLTFYDAIKGIDDADLDDPNITDKRNGDTLDMLGLINSTSVQENAENGDVTISVSGTDFSKMLHKDAALFYAGAGDNTLGGATDYNSVWFLNDQAKLKESLAYQRLFTNWRVEGQIQDLNLYINQPIRFWLEFIRTKLSSSKITLEDYLKQQKPLELGTDYQYVKNEDGEFGIWQLIKLIVDPNIQNYELTDSTIASSAGNLMSFAQKVCQEPWVEFFCDTYGDRYYWIARKPPFDRNSFLDPVGVQHIEEADLLDYQLNFDDADIYSWYKIKPTLWYQGDDSFSDFNFVSAFFPQFADLYGAQALEVSSMYIDYGLAGVNSGNGLKQAINDMRWLIETNAHLFATRKGTITLSGKRTIKRGMRVYLESTDELFYVDSVQNNYSVGRGGTDRTTQITVSRGIVLSHASRYFEVIDFKEDIVDVDVSQVGSDDIQQDPNNPKKKVKSWQVNEENFYFLLQRLQFCSSEPPEETFEQTRVREVKSVPKFY